MKLAQQTNKQTNTEAKQEAPPKPQIRTMTKVLFCGRMMLARRAVRRLKMSTLLGVLDDESMLPNYMIYNNDFIQIYNRSKFVQSTFLLLELICSLLFFSPDIKDGT